jgi:viologen exporter family transport system permease protein
VVDAVRTYGLLAWTWLRAAAQFPVSMVLLMLGTALVATLDIASIALLFLRAVRLGGFTSTEVLFLYATAGFSFGLADILLGTTERLGEHVRKGTLDATLVRPVSPLIQLATEDFSPRRLGKLIPVLLVLALVLPRLHVHWTAGRVAMLPVMMLSGLVIFGALWVLTASLQFVLVESHAATKSVTYGGSYLVQYPMSIFGKDFVRGVTFVLPLAFVNWEPSLYVLGHRDPLGLPGFLRFASPAVAAVLCALAVPAWRAGLRRYRSTGS